jgi:hypothetical protein
MLTSLPLPLSPIPHVLLSFLFSLFSDLCFLALIRSARNSKKVTLIPLDNRRSENFYQGQFVFLSFQKSTQKSRSPLFLVTRSHPLFVFSILQIKCTKIPPAPVFIRCTRLVPITLGALMVFVLLRFFMERMPFHLSFHVSLFTLHRSSFIILKAAGFCQQGSQLL